MVVVYFFCKTDSLVSIKYDQATQQTIVAGAGELHLDVILSDLRALCGFQLTVGDPVVWIRPKRKKLSVVLNPIFFFFFVKVALRETCVGVCEASLAKSASKLNRVYIGARPAPESLVAACEEASKEKGRKLV